MSALTADPTVTSDLTASAPHSVANLAAWSLYFFASFQTGREAQGGEGVCGGRGGENTTSDTAAVPQQEIGAVT